jgi:hypothetical protein
MTIQMANELAKYKYLLPIYLLALRGADEDSEDFAISEIRLQLRMMARKADKWDEHTNLIKEDKQ